MQAPKNDPVMLELMKRDRKLQAIAGQRELNQAEKDEWEELVRKITARQEELSDEMGDEM